MMAIAAESADGIANIEPAQRCCQAKIVLKTGLLVVVE